MPFSLKNHVAIITGSTTGLGKAMAQTLGKQGAKVAVKEAKRRADGLQGRTARGSPRAVQGHR